MTEMLVWRGVDKTIGFGLYQSCGNRERVGRFCVWVAVV